MLGWVVRSACSRAAASTAAAVARHDCCVVVVDLVVAVAATLVFAVASDCRAAASAAAAVTIHDCYVFFFMHTADVSSTGIGLHASGRSPQTSCIYSGAYDVICVFRPTSRAASSKHGR